MITIITTSYNYNEYICETIKSVQDQTFSDWELIIVDDASTDNSVEIIKSFCEDKRIKLICHDKNKGLRKSIQTGLKYAKGEWIAFLESDDFFCTNTLEERIKNCPNNVGFIFNSVNLTGEKDWIDEVQKQVTKTEEKLEKLQFPCNMFKYFDKKNPILTLSSVMIKKELFTENLLNSPVDSLLDWWIYINLAFKNDFYYLPKKLTNWRIHSNSYIKKPHKRHFCLVNVLAYINVFKENPSFDLFCFIVKCFLEMCLIRLRVYFIGFIRNIKKLFGLKTKKSPLFD